MGFQRGRPARARHQRAGQLRRAARIAAETGVARRQHRRDDARDAALGAGCAAQRAAARRRARRSGRASRRVRRRILRHAPFGRGAALLATGCGRVARTAAGRARRGARALHPARDAGLHARAQRRAAAREPRRHGRPRPRVSRALAAIAPAERRALERLDVPHFTIAGTGADLDSGDGDEISIPVLAPGFADLGARLQRGDEADLRRQVAIVRGMFHARTARGFDVTSGAKPLPQPADPRMRRELAASFVAAPRAIGDALADASVPERDGSVSWLGLAHHAGADRFALEPLGFDLYGGTGGIALFFAALAAVTDEPRYRAHALAAADGLRRRLREPDAARALAARIGIGGATGAGSIVYALVRMASLLGEHALLDDARAAAAFVDDDAIARDDVFDPIAGAAGAIFGLIALHRAAPDASVLARAVAAGDHVLRHRTGAPGRRAWKNFADVPLTGMAHGAAGIALALVRLQAASGERRC